MPMATTPCSRAYFPAYQKYQAYLYGQPLSTKKQASWEKSQKSLVGKFSRQTDTLVQPLITYIWNSINNKLGVIVTKAINVLGFVTSFNNIIIITSSKTQSTGGNSLELDPLLAFSIQLLSCSHLSSCLHTDSNLYQTPQKIYKRNTQALAVFSLKHYLLRFPAIPSFRSGQCPLAILLCFSKDSVA